MVLFNDRVDAGRQLAEVLERFRDDDVIVLGLPRGGVPVAAEVATALHAPLDVLVVRKLGVPGEPELAMGAIGEEGVRMLNPRVLALAAVTESQLDQVESREREVLAARVAELRRGQPRLDLTGRTALIVDDGVATGATAQVACRVARLLGAEKVVLAAPVIAADTVSELGRTRPGARATRSVARIPVGGADEVAFVSAPFGFAAVGQYYRDFAATEDTEVTALLDHARRRHSENG